jgi:hypothetical protein
VKTFCSAQDIEDLAAQGKTELFVNEDMVLTDLARHTAEQYGISLVYRSHSEPLTKAPPPVPESPRTTMNGLGARPRGCQHGPLTGQRSESAVVADNSNTVVDQLVSLVRRFGGRGTGD